MREYRIVLENHADIPLGRGNIVNHLGIKGDRSAFNGIEAGNHPEKRRLPAAGRTQQRKEFSFLHVQAQIGNNRIVPVFFHYMVKMNSNAHL